MELKNVGINLWQMNGLIHTRIRGLEKKMKTTILALAAIFTFIFLYTFLGRLWLKFTEYMYEEYDINTLNIFPLSSKDETIVVLIWVIIMPVQFAFLLIKMPFILSQQALEFIFDIPNKEWNIRKLLKKNKKIIKE